MTHPTETVNGVAVPAPGKWVVNWVEGDVVSWRHDPDPDTKIHGGATAHAFVTSADFGTVDIRVEINHTTVETIDDVDDVTDALARVGDILTNHPR